jgi:hypothetical protein
LADLADTLNRTFRSGGQGYEKSPKYSSLRTRKFNEAEKAFQRLRQDEFDQQIDCPAEAQRNAPSAFRDR